MFPSAVRVQVKDCGLYAPGFPALFRCPRHAAHAPGGRTWAASSGERNQQTFAEGGSWDPTPPSPRSRAEGSVGVAALW